MKNKSLLVRALGIVSLLVLAMSQIGAASASSIHGHEPLVPEKLRIND